MFALCGKKKKDKKIGFLGGKVNKFAHNGKHSYCHRLTENQYKYPKFDFHF